MKAKQSDLGAGAANRFSHDRIVFVISADRDVISAAYEGLNECQRVHFGTADVQAGDADEDFGFHRVTAMSCSAAALVTCSSSISQTRSEHCTSFTQSEHE